MNSRPTSENAFGLAQVPIGFIPTKGFRWVLGRSGATAATAWSSWFLVPNPNSSGRPKTPPPDIFLEFGKVKSDMDSILEFANRFGYLGEGRIHFHSEDCKEVFGESFGGWSIALSQFQSCFDLWQAAEAKDIAFLSNWIKERSREWDRRITDTLMKDPVKMLKTHVTDKINFQLTPGVMVMPWAQQDCFREGCRIKRQIPSVTPCVSCSLQASKNGVEIRLVPNSLISTIYLQFADLVCGARRIRRCEVCGDWMDISKTARPGAKRMHRGCSLARRMRKWRANGVAHRAHPPCPTSP